MADIQFMDVSENDTPATTDSILIGNKDNGVKRTTLGKLADTEMFTVHGLLKLQEVDTPLKAQTFHYSITAPTIEGYQFAFWLNSATEGFIASTYIDYPNNSQAKIWITDLTEDQLKAYLSSSYRLSAFAVYIKNSVA